MARPKASDELTEKLDALFLEIKPEDVIIMLSGFIAGTQGYTPMSALMSSGGLSIGTDSLKEKAAKGDVVAGFSSGLSTIPGMPGVGGLIGAITAGFNGLFPSENMTEEEKVMKDSVMSKIALGCIGLIEAYAITRPGTVAGVGEIVKGIGEIVPL